MRAGAGRGVEGLCCGGVGERHVCMCVPGGGGRRWWTCWRATSRERGGEGVVYFNPKKMERGDGRAIRQNQAKRGGCKGDMEGCRSGRREQGLNGRRAHREPPPTRSSPSLHSPHTRTTPTSSPPPHLPLTSASSPPLSPIPPHSDVRLAACNALAAVSVAQEGRDAIRTAGGLRPLVLLLGGGCGGGGAGATTAAAALALMNCSACDVCKVGVGGGGRGSHSGGGGPGALHPGRGGGGQGGGGGGGRVCVWREGWW